MLPVTTAHFDRADQLIIQNNPVHVWLGKMLVLLASTREV